MPMSSRPLAAISACAAAMLRNWVQWHRLKIHGQPKWTTGRGEDGEVVSAALKVVIIAGD